MLKVNNCGRMTNECMTNCKQRTKIRADILSAGKNRRGALSMNAFQKNINGRRSVCFVCVQYVCSVHIRWLLERCNRMLLFIHAIDQFTNLLGVVLAYNYLFLNDFDGDFVVVYRYHTVYRYLYIDLVVIYFCVEDGFFVFCLHILGLLQ